MKKSKKMEITLEYLEERRDAMRRDIEKINKMEEPLSERNEGRRERLYKEVEIYDHVISFTEMELSLQRIKEEDEGWTWEKEAEADARAHAETTIEIEEGKEIPLTEWARINKVDPANARQRAQRGTLPAHKIGNTWMIRENVKNIDRRRG